MSWVRAAKKKLHYEDQLINVVMETNLCLHWEPYETNKDLRLMKKPGQICR
jgi:hypothetical protein